MICPIFCWNQLYIQNSVARVPLMRKVFTKLGGEITFTDERIYTKLGREGSFTGQGLYKTRGIECLYWERYIQYLVERLPLVRKVYIKFSGVGTFTLKTCWRGYFYWGRYIQNLVERVPLLNNVYINFGGNVTFTEEGIYERTPYHRYLRKNVLNNFRG